MYTMYILCTQDKSWPPILLFTGINGVYVAEFPRPYIFMHASGQANDKKCIQFIIYLLVLYYHTVADLHSGFFTRHPFEKFWP